MTVVTRSHYYRKALRLLLSVTVAAGAVSFLGSAVSSVPDSADRAAAKPDTQVTTVVHVEANGDWPWGPIRATASDTGGTAVTDTTTGGGDWPWL